ncbi:hypothetical protein GN956_G25306 [Arapaima gigas]
MQMEVVCQLAVLLWWAVASPLAAGASVARESAEMSHHAAQVQGEHEEQVATVAHMQRTSEHAYVQVEEDHLTAVEKVQIGTAQWQDSYIFVFIMGLVALIFLGQIIVSFLFFKKQDINGTGHGGGVIGSIIHYASVRIRKGSL